MLKKFLYKLFKNSPPPTYPQKDEIWIEKEEVDNNPYDYKDFYCYTIIDVDMVSGNVQYKTKYPYDRITNTSLKSFIRNKVRWDNHPDKLYIDEFNKKKQADKEQRLFIDVDN